MVTVISFGPKPTVSLRNMGATAIVRPYAEKGEKGEDGLPGPNSVPADTAVGTYANTDGSFTANGIDARIDKRMPFTTPEMHGAVGDGTTDDTTALRAAIDALAANGGGRVVCSKRHGFKGILTVKNGVYLEGPATRQGPAMTASPSTPGLLALDGTAQLQVGDWTSNSNPGGVVNLYVDGNKVGASSTAKTGLVRLAGVSTEIRGLFVHRSGGDGIVVDGLQNSTIVGGFSVGHAGAALVLDNGCGGLSFTGGYYGTSKGGTHLCRDTAGQANLYPFGPTNITFTGTMFESYGGQPAPLDEPHARHVHISGRNLTYVGCNFTGGAQNTAAATVLVDDTVTGGIPATVSFDNCIYWARGGYDVVRIAGNSSVAFVGRQESSDDGTNHAASFVCVDGGFPHVAMVGEVLMAGDVDGDLIWRAINSGSMLGTYADQSGGQVYRLNADQSLGIRATGDTINKFQLEGNGTIRWTDGSGGAIAPHTDGLLLSGRSIFSDGIGVIAETISVTTAAQSVALDAKTSVEWRLSFAATGDGVSALTVANALDGSRLRVGLFGTGVNTMTWATNMSFASTAPQPVDGQAIFVDFEYVATASKWMETGRSTAVADDTEVAALVSASGSATHAALSATYAALTKRVVKTANYTAQANDLVACDTTSGTFTVTIPAASGGKARIGVKWIAGTVAPSIVLSGTDKLNISTGVTSATPSLLNQGYVIESDGTSIWTVVADDLPLSQLDGRYASLPSSGKNRLTGWYHADGYGVDLTGATDSTTALGNWISAIPAGGTGYLPPGTVKATAALPQPATGVVLRGAGESSIITFAPASANATMMTLSSGQQRVRFQDLQFSFAAGGNSATGRLFALNGVFRNSWTRCRIQGWHAAAADSYAVTTGHVGVAITGNAGDNLFYDCDFLNLGVGIMTDSIQNGVIGGKFGTCYVGILGTSNIDGDGQANSGMSLVGHIDFVSAPTAGLVKNNIWIDGAAGQWWLTNVWFEGADVPILVGDTSGNGPTQFGIVNAKVASTTAGIHLQSCRQPYLANIQFSANGAATPTPLIVDAARVNEGVASNLINVMSGLGTDPFAAALPNGVGNSPGWIYLGRTSVYLPNNTYLRSGSSLRFTRSDGATAGQVSLSGSSVQLLGVLSSSATALFKFGDNASKSILELDNISSGANAIGIANAVTGNSPTVDARGTDTNVSLTLKAKGTGQVIATSPVVFPNYTTTARNALAGVVAGSTVYDTTLHKLVTYDGTGWRDQSATSV